MTNPPEKSDTNVSEDFNNAVRWMKIWDMAERYFGSLCADAMLDDEKIEALGYAHQWSRCNTRFRAAWQRAIAAAASPTNAIEGIDVALAGRLRRTVDWTIR